MDLKEMNSISPCVFGLVLSMTSCALSEGIRCNETVECGGSPGTECVSDYCQVSPCSSDKDCVTGQVCSHDTRRECVYQISLKAEENSEFILKFKHPVPTGTTLEEIRWYKGSRSNSIVYYEQSATGGKPKYFHDYCASDCNSSNKVSLNIKTGDLTIKAVGLRDEDFYYYKFSVSENHEAGEKYEIKVEVSSVGGDVGLYVGVVVAVLIVLAIVIGCVVFAFRYKKMKKRLKPIYTPGRSAEL